MKKQDRNCRSGLTIILVVIAVLLMGGCAGMNNIQEKIDKGIQDNRDIFLAHMEEKYDVTFLPISYSASGVVTNEEFRCYAQGTDRERDYVSVFRREENGGEVIYDDYFGILVRDEYQKRVQDICDETIGESKAFVHRYSVSYFSNELTSEHTLDDAIAMGESITASKYVYFEVEPGTEEAFEAACDRVMEKLKDAKLTGFISFMGLTKGELANISEDNYLDYLPSMVKPDGTICLMMTSRSVRLQ